MSKLSTYFAQQQFCFSIEYIEKQNAKPELVHHIAGYPACLAVADRVHSDEDRAPLDIAKDIVQSDLLLHYSGKGRDIKELKIFLLQAQQRQHFDVLMLTGDKLKQHHFGLDDPTLRSRYLESVNSVQYAKNYDQRFHIGVAFNPFKYTHSERQAQYLKLHKKIQVGADFIVCQLGFDIEQLKRLMQYRQQQGWQTPVMACVMPLSYQRAKFLIEHKVAGIVIATDLFEQLKQEFQQDPQIAEQRMYQRAALHILICKALGFAGIHLSGCEKKTQITKLEQAIQQYKNLTLQQCWQKYLNLNQVNGQSGQIPENGAKETASAAQITKYYFLSRLHAVFFHSKLAMRFGYWLFSAKFWKKSQAQRTLLILEHASKHALVGCESCGQCRLDQTLYICPETCPKGLANGPCGGTTLDRCEFNDRECIHSQKFRIAEQVQQLNILKDQIIPTVSIESRGQSSWLNWFQSQQCSKELTRQKSSVSSDHLQ
ncbi:methylenetetrahydrofolate reductase [Acinetobacter qingfengensis]|uniref:Methylenetetrahydrofolate reductase n=1 Tax=Acinetobacter qingfengensis TaxID=1262585 RepID=A0A1E7RCP3_9GAMM|nr:methylenetetrahydrofolate reductase C-terminal domain-containing protein [Acinetobacter qingfengensis]KAA8732099.1 methylenetetrahydrofolate reductase [Acinetobacter qingfengensis]OEY97179.1 hypothetical protein BJI46_01760 [Acinetobacter qingfengensis]